MTMLPSNATGAFAPRLALLAPANAMICSAEDVRGHIGLRKARRGSHRQQHRCALPTLSAPPITPAAFVAHAALTHPLCHLQSIRRCLVPSQSRSAAPSARQLHALRVASRACDPLQMNAVGATAIDAPVSGGTGALAQHCAALFAPHLRPQLHAGDGGQEARLLALSRSWSAAGEWGHVAVSARHASSIAHTRHPPQRRCVRFGQGFAPQQPRCCGAHGV